MKSVRSGKGNILFLAILTLGIVISVGVGGFIFNGYLFGCTRAQYQVDALAVDMAGKSNVVDRVGQINELEECARELIYVSRRQFEYCEEQDVKVLESLCYELLEEARAGQQLVEAERKNQVEVICAQIQGQA